MPRRSYQHSEPPGKKMDRRIEINNIGVNSLGDVYSQKYINKIVQYKTTHHKYKVGEFFDSGIMRGPNRKMDIRTYLGIKEFDVRKRQKKAEKLGYILTDDGELIDKKTKEEVEYQDEKHLLQILKMGASSGAETGLTMDELKSIALHIHNIIGGSLNREVEVLDGDKTYLFEGQHFWCTLMGVLTGVLPAIQTTQIIGNDIENVSYDKNYMFATPTVENGIKHEIVFLNKDIKDVSRARRTYFEDAETFITNWKQTYETRIAEDSMTNPYWCAPMLDELKGMNVDFAHFGTHSNDTKETLKRLTDWEINVKEWKFRSSNRPTIEKQLNTLSASNLLELSLKRNVDSIDLLTAAFQLNDVNEAMFYGVPAYTAACIIEENLRRIANFDSERDRRYPVFCSYQSVNAATYHKKKCPVTSVALRRKDLSYDITDPNVSITNGAIHKIVSTICNNHEDFYIEGLNSKRKGYENRAVAYLSYLALYVYYELQGYDDATVHSKALEAKDTILQGSSKEVLKDCAYIIKEKNALMSKEERDLLKLRLKREREMAKNEKKRLREEAKRAKEARKAEEKAAREQKKKKKEEEKAQRRRKKELKAANRAAKKKSRSLKADENIISKRKTRVPENMNGINDNLFKSPLKKPRMDMVEITQSAHDNPDFSDIASALSDSNSVLTVEGGQQVYSDVDSVYDETI